MPMKERIIKDAMQALASTRGVEACALVDSGSGLVWHAEGAAEQPLWEASIDYWRLHCRTSAHFEPLGELRAAVMYHRHKVLALLPCGGADQGLVVVCIAAHVNVDWSDCQRRVRLLGADLMPGGRPTATGPVAASTPSPLSGRAPSRHLR